MSDSLPYIVLVGRPNVGKSTLFNRLIRSNRAITHDRPGVTRDRMEGVVRRKDLPSFGIVDTGGITLDAHAAVTEGPEGIRGFERDILTQAEAALAGAAAVAFVVDGRDGLLPLDEHLAAHVRAHGPAHALRGQQGVDGGREDLQMAEFHSLGFPLLPVSAEHGYNINALCEDLAALLPEGAVRPPAPPALRLAMLGRPNAGKSSLINALAGEERMIVSDVAGTTRDSVDVRFRRDGQDYVFVDTAGVRRRTRITDSVEKYSVNAAIKSSTKADVTLLTLDATEGVSQQDKRLMDMLDTRKTPFMVLINKCDLIPPAALAALKKNITETLAFCGHAHPGSFGPDRHGPQKDPCPWPGRFMRNARCASPRAGSTGPWCSPAISRRWSNGYVPSSSTLPRPKPRRRPSSFSSATPSACPKAIPATWNALCANSSASATRPCASICAPATRKRVERHAFAECPEAGHFPQSGSKQPPREGIEGNDQ